MDKGLIEFNREWYKKLRWVKHLWGVVVRQKIETGKVLMKSSRK